LVAGQIGPSQMRVTQDLNSFGEIIAHAHYSVDEKNVDASKNIFRLYHIRTFALLYGKTELSTVKYFAICS
jgi:hypothetical protein